MPPATPAAAARRREPDPLRDEGPAATAPPHPRETGYPHPSLGADPEPEARRGAARPVGPGAPAQRVQLRAARRHPGSAGRRSPRRRRAPRLPRRACTRACGDPYARSSASYDESPWGAKVAGSPVIRVVGVGGAGVNAVNRMVEAEVQGVEFLAINTDLQSLQQSTADITLHIGPQVTRGLGAGSNPDLGRQAAMEEYDRIKSLMKGSDMVFIAAGSGGGTGTGAAPIVARIAREIGALTVGIVTKPFGFEGSRRAQQADVGIEALHAEVDTLIVVPNNRLLSVLDKHTSMVDAFRVADDVLRQGVQGVSDLVTLPGIINLDFADVRTIMSEAGAALLGIGMGVGRQACAGGGRAGRVLTAAGDEHGGRPLDPAVDHRRQGPVAVGGQRGGQGRRGRRPPGRQHHLRRDGGREARGPGLGDGRGHALRQRAQAPAGAATSRSPRARRAAHRASHACGAPPRERITASRSGGVVSDLDVPEFLPRR